MEKDKNGKSEKKKKNLQDRADKWIEKAEDFMDETSDKVHKSDTYRKADQSMEKATKKIFRKAGKLWGKSERYLNKKRGKDEK